MAQAHRLAVEPSDQSGHVAQFNQSMSGNTKETKYKPQNYREAV
jgi:hypothetical protein